MTEPAYKDSFPRGALIAAAIMLGATLLFVGYVQFTDRRPVAEIDKTSVVDSRQLKFADDANGDVIVYAALPDGAKQPIAVLAPGTNGFLRSVMRGLVQARRFDDIGRSTPFTLSRLADGRLVLFDPTTSRRIDLRAFGQTNADAFAALLHAPALDAQAMAEIAPQRTATSP